MNTVMTRPHHHPSEALLVAYAAGSLSEAQSLALCTHLAFCPACRRRSVEAEAVGGALLERIEPLPLAAAGLESVMARLDREPRESRAVPRAAVPGRAVPALPQPLAGYVESAASAAGWRMAGPGVQQLKLATGGGAQARLLRLKPGTPLPEHTHRGSELTLVLAGSYSDELGRFARGDLAELDETVDHRPVVDHGETCVALIVTDAPLKFRGLMARLAQPFIGI